MKVDGNNWIPESSGQILLHDVTDLEKMTEKYGFIPYFKCSIDGFSIEEFSDPQAWWSGDERRDPWEWRKQAAERGNVIYSKIFNNKAGFVSKEWFPILASYRRDGYDFDSRWDDEIATRREKLIMDELMSGEMISSFHLRRRAGFGKNGEKGFEGTVTRLMMQTYVIIRGFYPKKNSRGEDYGWAIAHYSTPEALFGRDFVAAGYVYEREEAFEKLCGRVMELFPDADRQTVRKLMK